MSRPTFSKGELLAIVAIAIGLLWWVIPAENLRPLSVDDPPYRYHAPDDDNPALRTYSYRLENEQSE
jgi:hypothetical protein